MQGMARYPELLAATKMVLDSPAMLRQKAHLLFDEEAENDMAGAWWDYSCLASVRGKTTCADEPAEGAGELDSICANEVVGAREREVIRVARIDEAMPNRKVA